MPTDLSNQLVVALSSRALFDFEEENRVFEEGDDRAYMQLQSDRMQLPANPGVAFPLVRKLLAFNTPERQRVEIVVLSRNDPVSGLRVYHSAQSHGLPIQRGVFTRGRSPYRYLKSLGAHLFLSANASDVEHALEAGYPAAHVYPHSAKAAENSPNELRIAFDGDAVLFSDEAEQVYQQQGLDAFVAHETQRKEMPLPPGPFKPLLLALQQLQQDTKESSHMCLRTALVTARSAPAHERAVRTLITWKIDIDEAMFLGGLDKGDFLREFEPDFFFDDQTRHCDSGAKAGPTGHVPSGIKNQPAT
jgi:5'-nucleotidase